MTTTAIIALAAVVVTLLVQTAALAYWGGRLTQSVRELERWRAITEQRLIQLDRRRDYGGAGPISSAT